MNEWLSEQRVDDSTKCPPTLGMYIWKAVESAWLLVVGRGNCVFVFSKLLVCLGFEKFAFPHPDHFGIVCVGEAEVSWHDYLQLLLILLLLFFLVPLYYLLRFCKFFFLFFISLLIFVTQFALRFLFPSSSFRFVLFLFNSFNI